MRVGVRDQRAVCIPENQVTSCLFQQFAMDGRAVQLVGFPSKRNVLGLFSLV